MKPTAARLHELLVYQPATGVLRWRVTRSFKAVAGSVAGRLEDGYVRVSIDNRLYRAHRVIWAMQTGAWPTFQIDHQNRTRSDNRWDNLRPATGSQQMGNRSLNANNATGFKGVHYCRASKRFVASIGVRGRRKTIGRFPDVHSAAAAYAKSAAEVFGEYASP